MTAGEDVCSTHGSSEYVGIETAEKVERQRFQAHFMSRVVGVSVAGPV